MKHDIIGAGKGHAAGSVSTCISKGLVRIVAVDLVIRICRHPGKYLRGRVYDVAQLPYICYGTLSEGPVPDLDAVYSVAAIGQVICAGMQEGGGGAVVVEVVYASYILDQFRGISHVQKRRKGCHAGSRCVKGVE